MEDLPLNDGLTMVLPSSPEQFQYNPQQNDPFFVILHAWAMISTHATSILLCSAFNLSLLITAGTSDTETPTILSRTVEILPNVSSVPSSDIQPVAVDLLHINNKSHTTPRPPLIPCNAKTTKSIPTFRSVHHILKSFFHLRWRWLGLHPPILSRLFLWRFLVDQSTSMRYQYY